MLTLFHTFLYFFHFGLSLFFPGKCHYIVAVIMVRPPLAPQVSTKPQDLLTSKYLQTLLHWRLDKQLLNVIDQEGDEYTMFKRRR